MRYYRDWSEPRALWLPENAGEIPLDAITVAARIELTKSADDRSLILWLLHKSTQPGGIAALDCGYSARDIACCCISTEHALWGSVRDRLLKLKKEEEESLLRSVASTQLSRQIWSELDRVQPHRIRLFYGKERTGKSVAFRAWAKAHAGTARFVTLSGIVNRGSFWSDMAKGLGIAEQARSSFALQRKVEYFLLACKPLLFIDEAHYLFGDQQAANARPQFLDWIDTKLHNYGIPAVLVTTPQFIGNLARVEKAGYNSRQFKGRSVWTELPSQCDQADLLNIARNLAPGADDMVYEAAIFFALDEARTCAMAGAMGELMDVANSFCASRGGTAVTIDDLELAIAECVKSDAAKKTLAVLSGSRSGRRGVRKNGVLDGSDQNAGAAAATALQMPCNRAAVAQNFAPDGLGVPTCNRLDPDRAAVLTAG